MNQILYFVACTNNEIEVVKTLLQLEDGTVDPCESNYSALRLASRQGNEEIIKLVLADKRVDINSAGNCAMFGAIMGGQVELVNFLMKDKRIDIDCDGALNRACSSDYPEVVKLLLTDKRFDPTNNKFVPCYVESGYCNAEVASVLSLDERVGKIPIDTTLDSKKI